jgi:predicted metal-dependent hydrolase
MSTIDSGPSAHTPIHRRSLELAFDPAAVPRDWCAADPFLSTFCDSLSVLFPEGERFFIDSVKLVRHEVDDPALLADVAGFIGQEAMHGREHRAFNAMLVGHGFASAPRVEARLRRLLDLGRLALSPHTQLAITCALEHFTAMMAEALLGNDGMLQEMDPSVRPLWVWHALEESEHKAVAFDVYRATDGGAWRRIITMIPVSLLFVLVAGATQARFLAERGILHHPWRWLRGITGLWLWPGYLTRLLPAYLSYFRPGFHPNDRDARALLDAWRERLFGAAGELRPHLGESEAEAA